MNGEFNKNVENLKKMKALEMKNSLNQIKLK
jgi:hypothetical protein